MRKTAEPLRHVLTKCLMADSGAESSPSPNPTFPSKGHSAGAEAAVEAAPLEPTDESRLKEKVNMRERKYLAKKKKDPFFI